MRRANDFGVPWNQSYGAFLKQVPRCKLLWYYDGADQWCTEGNVGDRITNIVNRYDEIVELDGEGALDGDVERKVKEWMQVDNQSDHVDMQTMEEEEHAFVRIENMLYQAFRERKKLLAEGNHHTSPFCMHPR